MTLNNISWQYSRFLLLLFFSRSPQKLFTTRSDRSSVSLSEDDYSFSASSINLPISRRSDYHSPTRNGAAVKRSSSVDRRQQTTPSQADQGHSATERKASPLRAASPVKNYSDRLAIDNKVDNSSATEVHLLFA
jgi:hypothetical protein